MCSLFCIVAYLLFFVRRDVLCHKQTYIFFFCRSSVKYACDLAAVYDEYSVAELCQNVKIFSDEYGPLTGYAAISTDGAAAISLPTSTF